MAVAHDVVKHGVMSRMRFDDAAHGGDFVGVENRAEIGLLPFENRGQGRGHPHVFVRQDHARLGLAGGPERVKGGDRRLGEAHVLLKIPDVFELRTLDAEFLPELVLKLADFPGVVSADIQEEHFRRADHAGGLIT